EQAARDPEEEHVLGEPRALLGRAHAVLARHPRRLEVHAHEPCGEHAEAQGDEAGGDERHDERGAERDLGRGERLGELLRLDVLEERVRPRRHPVDALRGRVVRAALAQAGVEDVRTRREARDVLAELDHGASWFAVVVSPSTVRRGRRGHQRVGPASGTGPRAGRPARRQRSSRCRMARCASRLSCFSRSACRLSYSFLPRASAISTFARPSRKYSASGTIVCPFSRDFDSRRRISSLCRSSLRLRRGAWLFHVPSVYSGMWTFSSHASPWSTATYPATSDARPMRSALASVPDRTIPASYTSSMT